MPEADLATPQDRAFVDGMVRLQWAKESDREKRAMLEEIRARTERAALEDHAELRTKIASGTLRGDELRRFFDDVPLLERDHFVEEVLGIAYPPLEEQVLDAELVAYCPSGYDEIVHAFDRTKLGPSDRFFDVGAGMGKAVLLAALLTGATSGGIELHPELVENAREAARSLSIDARCAVGDARATAFEDADVVFLYIPFTGSVLASVLERLFAARSRFVCASSLDADRYDLALVGEPRSWLHVYERKRA